MSATRRWPNETRMHALDLAEAVGIEEAASQLRVPARTIRAWVAKERAGERAERRTSETVTPEVVGQESKARPLAWSDLAPSLQDEQGQAAAQALDEVRRALSAGDTRRAQAAALTHAILVDKAKQTEAEKVAQRQAAPTRLDRDIESLLADMWKAAGLRRLAKPTEDLAAWAGELEAGAAWLRREIELRADGRTQLEESDEIGALAWSEKSHAEFVAGLEDASVRRVLVVEDARSRAAHLHAAGPERRESASVARPRRAVSPPVDEDVLDAEEEQPSVEPEPEVRPGRRLGTSGSAAVVDFPSRKEGDELLRRAGYGGPPSDGLL